MSELLSNIFGENLFGFCSRLLYKRKTLIHFETNAVCGLPLFKLKDQFFSFFLQIQCQSIQSQKNRFQSVRIAALCQLILQRENLVFKKSLLMAMGE